MPCVYTFSHYFPAQGGFARGIRLWRMAGALGFEPRRTVLDPPQGAEGDGDLYFQI